MKRVTGNRDYIYRKRNRPSIKTGSTAIRVSAQHKIA